MNGTGISAGSGMSAMTGAAASGTDSVVTAGCSPPHADSAPTIKTIIHFFIVSFPYRCCIFVGAHGWAGANYAGPLHANPNPSATVDDCCQNFMVMEFALRKPGCIQKH
jgi:hypothetical protein